METLQLEQNKNKRAVSPGQTPKDDPNAAYITMAEQPFKRSTEGVDPGGRNRWHRTSRKAIRRVRVAAGRARS